MKSETKINKIYIQDEKIVEDIQRDFSGIFPYLKIEFFSKSPKKNEFLAQIFKKKLKNSSVDLTQNPETPKNDHIA